MDTLTFLKKKVERVEGRIEKVKSDAKCRVKELKFERKLLLKAIRSLERISGGGEEEDEKE